MVNQKNKIYREEHKEYYQKYREEHKEEIKRKYTEWCKNNIERIRYLKNDWNKKNPKIHSNTNKIYAKNHPDRIKARKEAGRKLKHLKKKGFEFHHPDYSKPLDVEIIPIKKHQDITFRRIKS